MKFNRVKQAIVLVSFAIVALIIIQLYWANNAYMESEKQFHDKISVALKKSIVDINENATCLEMFSKVYINPQEGFFMIKQPWGKQNEFLSAQEITPDTLTILNPTKAKGLRYNYKSLKFSDFVTVDILLKFRMGFGDTVNFKNESKKYENLDGENFREIVSGDGPFYKRYDTSFVRTTLQKYLHQEGVTNTFYYGIIQMESDTLEYYSSGANPSLIYSSELKYPLNSDKYFSKPYNLSIYFENKEKTILIAVWTILITSIIVIVILISAFIYFVKTIMQQKKLSKMKNDFIDNMTHEFNTPISNIGLSIETLFENDSLDNEKSKRILHIIANENERLRENVERILQIAAVDKDVFNLKPENIPIESLIKKVLSVFDLRIENAHAKINYTNRCTEDKLFADETHLINVLYNLIDNAIKYSNETPIIDIFTENRKGELVITIKDNGKGIAKDELKKIFEKFYRITDENIQDVKGFGLGLSYVKNIVMAHKGRIEVNSELGKGTQFDIFIPFNYLLVK